MTPQHEPGPAAAAANPPSPAEETPTVQDAGGAGPRGTTTEQRGTKRMRSPTTPASSPKRPPSLNDAWTEHMSMSSGLAEFADLRYYEPGTTLSFVLDDHARYKAEVGRPPSRPAGASSAGRNPEPPKVANARNPQALEPRSTDAAVLPEMTACLLGQRFQKTIRMGNSQEAHPTSLPARSVSLSNRTSLQTKQVGDVTLCSSEHTGKIYAENGPLLRNSFLTLSSRALIL